MQKILAPFPLVRVVIPFAIGIAFGLHGNWNSTLLAIVACVFLAALAILGFLIRRASLYYPWHGGAAFGFFAATGILLASFSLQSGTEKANAIAHDVPVVLRIVSDPEIREDNVRCRARIIGVHSDSGVVAVDATTMLYLKRTTASEALHYGDEIVMKSGVKTPSPTMNPGEFDYAAWLKSQGIYFVCFAKDSWVHTGHHDDSWIKARALELRRYFKARMIVCGLQGQELAVSEALLLGQSSDIDPELLASYSASGTLHVLSVSGMHVALVFVVLLKLLAPLEKKKKTQWISFAIQFFVIWFYAFMTGMSPSVLRSVMMLSVIITGRVIKRDAHLLNTLAASAIILLIGNPLLLEDAGFLLSYCAVAGIVIAQPLIERQWNPQSKLLKPVWSLTSVTLAAQIFTFPLGLYFFQQFPTWFLLSNLIVIPLSTICLYAGLFLLSISWWTWAATWVAIVFGFLISVLNASVGFTEFLPAAVIQTSSWSGLEIFLLYTVILTLLIAATRKIPRAFFVTTTCTLALLITIAATRHHDSARADITIFHIRDGLVIGVRESKNVTLFTDSVTAAQPEHFSYHVYPAYEKSDIRDPDIIRFDGDDSVQAGAGIVYHGWLFALDKRIWLGGKDDVPEAPHDCDVLLIHSKNFWMIKQLRILHPAKIVLSGEVRKKWITKWKEEAKERGIPLHVTNDEGALILQSQ